MAVDKAAMLAAVAQAGTAGKQAYEQAQAAMAAQQAEAVRMALASGVAQNANMGAQAELERIISQPYQTRAAQLTSNQAAMTDWFNRLGVNANQWSSVMDGLTEAVAARAAADAGGGGGGSGGGGSGGGGDDVFDWYDNAKDAFGTEGNIAAGIAGEAKALGLNSRTTGLPRYLATRDYAINEWGVPGGIAEDWYQPSEFGQNTMGAIAAKPGSKNVFGKIVQGAQTTKGNQNYWVNQYKQTMKPKAAKKVLKKLRKRR